MDFQSLLSAIDRWCSKVFRNFYWTVESFSFATSSRFIIFSLCGLLIGLMCNLVFETISRWSVQQPAPHLSFVTYTSRRSLDLTMMKSIRCQCLVRGCIQDVLLRVVNRKIVLVIVSPWDMQVFRSRKPLLLHLPIPWWPRNPCQAW